MRNDDYYYYRVNPFTQKLEVWVIALLEWCPSFMFGSDSIARLKKNPKVKFLSYKSTWAEPIEDDDAR